MGFHRRLKEQINGLRDSFHFSNWPLILWKRLRKERTVVYRFSGHSIECDTQLGDHYSAKEVLGRGVYDPYIRQACPHSTCAYVNVGANIGAFDLAIARLGYEIAYALSIELNPHTFARLVRNLERNHLDRVQPLNVGIADIRDTIEFTPCSHSLADSLYAANRKGTALAETLAVPLQPLEEALRSSGFYEKSFDLLKLDCEGAEYAIIRSTPCEILKCFRHIVMELHPPPASESVEAVYEKLGQCGFKTSSPAWDPRQPPELRFWTRSS
jgi:FkbM family methyltransferase